MTWSLPMAKKLMMVNIRGREKSWGFEFYGDPRYLPEWVQDGLDVVIVENVIPEWVADLGLVRPWCFLQDVFNFKNPWAK